MRSVTPKSTGVLGGYMIWRHNHVLGPPPRTLSAPCTRKTAKSVKSITANYLFRAICTRRVAQGICFSRTRCTRAVVCYEIHARYQKGGCVYSVSYVNLDVAVALAS
eukprot:3751584-Rhodomonas_salina.2